MHTKISVRNLVEFIMRSGDLSLSSTGLKEPDAMQEGTRIHKKLQKKMGAGYQAEVTLSLTVPVSYDDIDFQLTVEGRADGVFSDESGVVIDEIKGVYRDIHSLKEPVSLHRAQVLCYAFIYATLHQQNGMGIRITYCHIPTEDIRYFTEYLSYEELTVWFQDLVQQYAKWIVWQKKWQEIRNQSLRGLDFPFPYREGQDKLVKGVYQSILRKKRLYIEAPTGVGKTISTIYPAAKAIGEGLAEKFFYLTAKTVTRTVAENTLQLLEEHHAQLKAVTLTAKEKICPQKKGICNPAVCERAKGHFDRINDAVFDVLTCETQIHRSTITAYAEKHMVCPFEMSLDISVWCDVIIGDYNYAFDPTANLKRFFSGETQKDYILLIDEAHNLVDRAREMFSASLIKEDFLALKHITKTKSKKTTTALESCNRALLELKRDCDSLKKYDNPAAIETFVLRLMRLCTVLEEFLQENEHNNSLHTIRLLPEEKDTLLDFYFQIRHFQYIYELTDEHYTVYSDYTATQRFRLHLQCMDPSANLDSYLKKVRCSIFFSATLLPIHYFREQLAGRKEDYAIYAPSPFLPDKRLLMIGVGVSTKYTMRGPCMYQKTADYIMKFSAGKKGNYMIFFPSFQMLENVKDYLLRFPQLTDGDTLLEDAAVSSATLIYSQKNAMSETERETFLSHFENAPRHTTLGLCVMGGIFGEGIDLKDSRLIGAVIVGTGIPMVCTENELFKEYFTEKKKQGFAYAYQYPGMNKVLQAAGRVIRTTQDVGAVLLLDERFLQNSYQQLFPREWFPYDVVTPDTIQETLAHFWKQWEP